MNNLSFKRCLTSDITILSDSSNIYDWGIGNNINCYVIEIISEGISFWDLIL